MSRSPFVPAPSNRPYAATTVRCFAQLLLFCFVYGDIFKAHFDASRTLMCAIADKSFGSEDNFSKRKTHSSFVQIAVGPHIMFSQISGAIP